MTSGGEVNHVKYKVKALMCLQQFNFVWNKLLFWTQAKLFQLTKLVKKDDHRYFQYLKKATEGYKIHHVESAFPSTEDTLYVM